MIKTRMRFSQKRLLTCHKTPQTRANSNIAKHFVIRNDDKVARRDNATASVEERCERGQVAAVSNGGDGHVFVEIPLPVCWKPRDNHVGLEHTGDHVLVDIPVLCRNQCSCGATCPRQTLSWCKRWSPRASAPSSGHRSNQSACASCGEALQTITVSWAREKEHLCKVDRLTPHVDFPTSASLPQQRSE